MTFSPASSSDSRRARLTAFRPAPIYALFLSDGIFGPHEPASLACGDERAEMIEGSTIAVVVPCYNEAHRIHDVLAMMPAFVDCIITVDDASTDGTTEVIRRYIDQAPDGDRVCHIAHEKNQGVGAAITTGYREAVKRRIDVTAVMAGDGQMDPKQLRALLRPVIHDQADYTKANRLYFRRSWDLIPRQRYLGNAFLSMLTKIASGYWHVADSQTGYTAISLHALEMIGLDGLYPRYGYPNDMLVRLNVYNFRVADVPVRPVYAEEARSKMKLWKVIPTMSWLILRRFFWRMWQKYVIRDFHPLVLFYSAALFTGLLSVLLFIRLIVLWIVAGDIPEINALVWAVTFISSTQFALFAMWFDMEMNRHLNPDARLTPTERRAGRAAPVSESNDEPDDPPPADQTETHGADRRDVPAR